ncbi:Pentatricopeptide repeat-containing protein [Durusdinium trenchii]|uniref:Chloroplastic n=1 Tax=Durusdinium trenchii TaxID=1381693 RepID=A0ABP0J2E6_9DINO
MPRRNGCDDHLRTSTFTKTFEGMREDELVQAAEEEEAEDSSTFLLSLGLASQKGQQLLVHLQTLNPNMLRLGGDNVLHHYEFDYLFGADWHLGFVHMLRLSSPLTYEDIGITEISSATSAGGEGADTGAMSSLKMLKLARLGRIVRLLKFKICTELKLMIQGVFTGLRVLFWAVVLLFLVLYLLGVVSRTLFGNAEGFNEFSNYGSIEKARP